MKENFRKQRGKRTSVLPHSNYCVALRLRGTWSILVSVFLYEDLGGRFQWRGVRIGGSPTWGYVWPAQTCWVAHAQHVSQVNLDEKNITGSLEREEES